MQLLQLPLVHRRGRIGHGTYPLLSLGKCDHIPDRFSAGQEHDDPVKSKGDPAVGRRAILKGLKEKSKLLHRFFFPYAKELKHLPLPPPCMDTDPPPADLLTIHDDIVCPCPDSQ